VCATHQRHVDHRRSSDQRSERRRSPGTAPVNDGSNSAGRLFRIPCSPVAGRGGGPLNFVRFSILLIRLALWSLAFLGFHERRWSHSEPSVSSLSSTLADVTPNSHAVDPVQRFAKPTRARSPSHESRRIWRYPAENLSSTILSWRVAICGLPRRSLHNLLHTAVPARNHAASGSSRYS
jgi:hypothetical protein